ncbi:effector protein B, substrate of the Dot/Icm secretion system [Legionella birminghamensis]|uniref:Effector protein B, substrate of the Dot/Icm secretion system n=1 Tax=Legionella birminghamensis TaxID=28083 RepID=A0A378IA36_9GAMM|nr:hypothetical protein [Legionella birminghamensis]KTC69398.1 effector protein B, substrate of the Dot/Icm secretion system [Legionella birminghamensis]STX31662.1 LepB protein [Legionella birminghamensis]
MFSPYDQTVYSSLKMQALEAIDQDNVEQLQELLKLSYLGDQPQYERKGFIIQSYGQTQGLIPYLNNYKDKKFLRDEAIQKDRLAVVDFLFNDGMGLWNELKPVSVTQRRRASESYRNEFLNIAVKYNSREVINYLLAKGFSLTLEQLQEYALKNHAEKAFGAISPIVNKIPLLTLKAKNLAGRGFELESKQIGELELFIRKEIKNYLDSCIAEPEKTSDLLEKNFKTNCTRETSNVQEKLKHHRGYKEFLANFMITLVSLSIANLGNLFATQGRCFFFQFNTDSVTKLNEVKTAVIECSF